MAVVESGTAEHRPNHQNGGGTRMYSPAIKPEQVRTLYQLKIKTGKKMTELVAEAIREYLARHSQIAEEVKIER